MKREELLNRLRKLKSQLIDEYDFTKLALFGSYARNEQSDNCDIPASSYHL